MLACSKSAVIRRCVLSSTNGQEASCHPVDSKGFEKLEAVTVQPVMCSRKAKVYWNDMESNGPQISVRIVQVYLDRMSSTMNQGVFILYPVYSVLLNFSLEFRLDLI